MHYVPPYTSECLIVSLMLNTHYFLFRLFCIHMLLYHTYSYVSIYLSVIHSYTQYLPYVSVSLSPSPSPSVFTSLCRYIMCTIVFICLSHSCHILVSTLTVRINLLNCVVTHVSLLARPPGCLFVFCV